METKRVVRLYPTIQVKGKSFKGIPRQTVPNQSMSLKEILRRFTRRESLPIEKQGVYEDRFIDLEKVQWMDLTEQKEYRDELEQWLHKQNKQRADAAAKQKAEVEAAAAAAAIPPK